MRCISAFSLGEPRAALIVAIENRESKAYSRFSFAPLAHKNYELRQKCQLTQSVLECPMSLIVG